MKRTYVVTSAVALASGVGIWIGRSEEIVQIISAIPFAGALLTLLLQVLLDNAAHQRAVFLQDAQNNFSFGVESHMAVVAFDKHVQFSEKYVKEAQESMMELLRTGPSAVGLTRAGNLHAIRNEFVIWLTAAVEESLDPFESALREIGANSEYYKATMGTEGEGAQRQAALEKMYALFAKVMGLKEWNGEKLNDDLAISSVIRKLRDILGTEMLMSLRSSTLDKAVAKRAPG